LKHLKFYLEWQHNVPLDQSNTANNRLDGNSNWFGAGQTGAPSKDTVSDAGVVDLHEDDIDLLDEEDEKIDKKEKSDTKSTIERNRREREKNKKESEIAKTNSKPDFISQWKRFTTLHKPGRAG